SSPAWLTRTPTVRQLPSAGNASSSTPSGALEYHAGVKPSRNLMLAASENGPWGTRVNVSMPPSHHAPPTFPLATASTWRNLLSREAMPSSWIPSWPIADLSLRLGHVRFIATRVTADTPGPAVPAAPPTRPAARPPAPPAPGPLVHTAWLPRSCSSG